MSYPNPSNNGFIIRPPTWDDAPALVELFNACSRELRGTEPASLAELHLAWQDPGRDFTTDGRVVTDARGRIVGYAAVYCSTPYVRNFLSVDIDPEHRGQGLGSTLTQWGEAHIRQQMGKAPADARVTLQSGTLSTYKAATQLLCDHGFAHVRSFYEMRIEMTSAPPAPLWPAAITVRSMIPNQEEEAVYRADVDAFRDHWGFVEQPFEEDFPRWLHYTQNHP
nr:GNAT family N-acetyltransferase [Caldilineaceae bacterium]